MIPQTLGEVDLSAKAARPGRKTEGFVMSRYFFTAVALGTVTLMLAPASVASAECIPIDDFNDGNDQGWTHLDGSEGKPWGPGTFDASSGEYHLFGVGEVPVGEAGWLASIWDGSSDPIYSDGFLRAKIRSNDETAIVVLVLRESSLGTSYGFGANSVNGHFFLSKFLNGPQVFADGFVPDEPFRSGEDWMLEAGAIGDRLSIKAWKLGEPEPSEPQWTHTDPSALPPGNLAVITWHWALEQTPPGIVDATYDDICFTPSVPGDFNYSSDLDVEDIDLLSAELHEDEPSNWFDLTNDGTVDGSDRVYWVHDLKNTWYGDADLNGEFNSSDMVQVFAAGKYETGQSAGWAEGNWDADEDGVFNSSDMVAAFVDGGYEKGLRTPVNGVPEPTSAILLLGSLIFIAIRRRRLDP